MHSFLNLKRSGIQFALFNTCGKPLMQKSAKFMPSGTILKATQKSPIYIFAMKYYFAELRFGGTKFMMGKKCGEVFQISAG